LHIQLPTGSERVMVHLLTAWAQHASMVSAAGTTVDLFLFDSLDELHTVAGSAPEKSTPRLQSASESEAPSDRIVASKVHAFVQAGFDPCSGAERSPNPLTVTHCTPQVVFRNADKIVIGASRNETLTLKILCETAKLPTKQRVAQIAITPFMPH
jgi:hypothetical protein